MMSLKSRKRDEKKSKKLSAAFPSFQFSFVVSKWAQHVFKHAEMQSETRRNVAGPFRVNLPLLEIVEIIVSNPCSFFYNYRFKLEETFLLVRISFLAKRSEKNLFQKFPKILCTKYSEQLQSHLADQILYGSF